MALAHSMVFSFLLMLRTDSFVELATWLAIMGERFGSD